MLYAYILFKKEAMEIGTPTYQMTLIISYIKYEIISPEKAKAIKLRIKATMQASLNDKLYKHFLQGCYFEP